MSKKLLESVVKSLRPNFDDYMCDADYWADYDAELDYLLQSESREDLITYINKSMFCGFSQHPDHHACTDVASTLQSADSSYAGVFKFN